MLKIVLRVIAWVILMAMVCGWCMHMHWLSQQDSIAKVLTGIFFAILAPVGAVHGLIVYLF